MEGERPISNIGGMRKGNDVRLTITRARTRDTLLRHKDLIRRAFEVGEYPGDITAIYGDLVANAHSDSRGIFIGLVDGSPRSLIVALLPDAPLMGYPQVPIAYSDGPPALARVMGARLREWVMRAGYDRFWCINLMRSDKAFLRVFRHAGQASVKGSIVEFLL
jgi:hypothetical protein